ncbi:MAG: phosphate acetyltransferase [Cyclobacteriaceae bacterium]
MTKAIYIATVEPNSGKSIVVLGLMRMLLGRMAKVGYFRPIIDDLEKGESDNHIATVNSYFDLNLEAKQVYAFTRSEVVAKQNEGKSNEIIEEIIEKYKQIEDQFDFVLVEGTDFSDEGSITEFDVNIDIAKNLGIPTIIVASGEGKTTSELISNIKLAHRTFDKKDVDVLCVFANKVQEENVEDVNKKLRKTFPKSVEIATIPRSAALGSPTIGELVKALKGKFLFGDEHVSRLAEGFTVGAMQLRNYLPKIGDNGLVITPGDRADIILGALQAHTSSNYPKISGIVLTGGLVPEGPIMKLIEGISEIIPIISVEKGTFEVANIVGAVKSKISANDLQKIEISINMFEKYAQVETLSDHLVTYEPKGMTPSMFQYNLLKRAAKERKHIVLPEGNDERILAAAVRLVAADVVDVTLIGNRVELESKARQAHIPLNFEKVTVLDPVESDYFDDYVQTLYELRKHKNVTHEMARDLMTDVSYFGTMMIHKGHADGMVSGAAHTTQHTIRPALQFIKTKPDTQIVSSVFFMCLEDRVSVFGDCAINPNPNAEQLAEIAISSAESSKSFGIEPKVAMLSYSSGASGKGADVDIVREATKIVNSKRPDLLVEGPIQYDAAVDMNVGKSKMPDSKVAGQASVLIFPDLNTGNNTYKAVQRETGAIAIGPMLQGLNKPVNDLSRGCTIDDVFNTVIITAIQAQSE